MSKLIANATNTKEMKIEAFYQFRKSAAGMDQAFIGNATSGAYPVQDIVDSCRKKVFSSLESSLQLSR